MPVDNGRPVRLKALNALRFVAAILVIVFHLEHKKTLYGLSSVWGKNHFISHIGYHAVTFFFVLSGFLITYLLILEKERHGKISIKKFYVRRSLRIAPVYFLTIAAAFLVAPSIPLFHIPGQTERIAEHFAPALALTSVFLSNVTFAVFGNLACVDQTWSVSTEEQFYLLWPLLIAAMAINRKLLAVLAIITIGSALLRFGHWSSAVSMLIYLNRFGCMAIGAATAVLVFRMPTNLTARIVTHPAALWSSLTFLFVLLVLPWPGLDHILPELLSVLFSVVIAQGALGRFPDRIFENPLLRLGGNMSYSLYMYHNFFIAFVCNLAISSSLTLPPWVEFVSIYILVFALSLGASLLSWRLLEVPALRLKERFQMVRSKA